MSEPEIFVSELLNITISRFEEDSAITPDTARGGTNLPAAPSPVIFLVVLPGNFGAASRFATFPEALSVVRFIEDVIRAKREAAATGEVNALADDEGALVEVARRVEKRWSEKQAAEEALEQAGYRKVDLAVEQALAEEEQGREAPMLNNQNQGVAVGTLPRGPR